MEALWDEHHCMLKVLIHQASHWTPLWVTKGPREKTRAQDSFWHREGHGWSQHLDLGTRRTDFSISFRALCTELGRARLLFEFTQWITTITLVELLLINLRSLYFKTNRDTWLLQFFFLGGENRCITGQICHLVKHTVSKYKAVGKPTCFPPEEKKSTSSSTHRVGLQIDCETYPKTDIP